MNIVAYTDFMNTTIKEQVNTAFKLNIENIILRSFEGKSVFDLDAAEIRIINRKVKQNKIDIYAVDPLILPYDLYNLTNFQEVLVKYEKTFKVANNLRVKKVVFRMPLIKNILSEYEIVEHQLKKVLDLAKKNNVTLLLKQGTNKNNTISYILRNYKSKDLKLLFNPKQIVLNNESVLVAYRLFKNDFDCIIASDIDNADNPELLGYGRVDLIDLFQRMIRDKYSGDILLDQSFGDFLNLAEKVVKVQEEEKKKSFWTRFGFGKGKAKDNNEGKEMDILDELVREEEITEVEKAKVTKKKKVPWFKRIVSFGKQPNINAYLKGYGMRIFPNEVDRIPTLFEIYESQINAIKIIFNLK